ncbi:MAG: folate family ECF transporter S component [Clostridiales bacterium]|nr:folate family ECF transporter S component [Candidatus Equinaster intestinalis]
MLKKDYWKEAAKQFSDLRMLAVAAVFIALRVAVKPLQLPLAAGLNLAFDCYVNSVGAMIYGPLVSLAVGAISDTLGCLLFPSGAYFFPFIFIEMASGFIFSLFFWRKKITVSRTILAKFTVNFICNIIMTSLVMKWDYYVFYGLEKAQAYSLINLTRIAKNLITFPIEAIIIFVILFAAMPALSRIKVIDKQYLPDRKIEAKHIILVIVLLLISVALILFYIFFLKDFVSAHNFKLL